MMTNGWNTVPLGEFLVQRKGFFAINDFTRYKRARVQLHARGIVLRDEVDGIEVKTKEQQAAHTGDFLVAEIDAKVGGFGIVPPELDNAIVSSHYFLFEINEQKCLRQWLDWFIRSGMLEEQVTAQGSTNYSAIRSSHVLKYEIPLPPLTEQRRIVTRIEALAARVTAAQSLRREASEEANLLEQAMYKTIWDKATAIAEKDYLENYALVLDPQPDHRTPAEVDGGMSYVSIANISLTGEVDLFGARKVSLAAIEKQEKAFKLTTGDIVLGKIGTIGAARTVIVKTRFALSANLVLVQPDRRKADPKFILALLKSPQMSGQFSTGVNSTAQSAFGIKKMRKLLIPVPSLPEQRRLVKYLDGLQAQVTALRAAQAESEQELSALMPSILDKAFKGEL